jgi:hypothetical protein
MLATIQRLVALTALTIFVLLQVFGAAWHQAAHAAEHTGAMSGLELADEDHGEDEHMQLPGAQMATPVLEAARPARWRSSTLPEGGMVDPTVPPPNA